MLGRCRLSAAVRFCCCRKMSGSGDSFWRYFLMEVGPFPNEARSWIRHFKENIDPRRSFAVIQIARLIFDDDEKVAKVCDSMAFLQKSGMPVVLVHGVDGSMPASNASEMTRNQVYQDSMQLVSKLSERNCPARPIVLMNTLQAERKGLNYEVTGVNRSALDWCLSSSSQHVPVVASLAETSDGQIVSLPTNVATQEIAAALQPMKVIFLEPAGGLRNLDRNIVPQVQFFGQEADVQSEPWCTGGTYEMVKWFSRLLGRLPARSSAVIADPEKLLQELFTRRGSGTIFQKREPIHRIKSLDDIDIKRIRGLLEESFRKRLSSDYFDRLDMRLDSIYVSEGYSLAAIVTKEQAASNLHYLDKFVVKEGSQGDGIAAVLWSKITEDYSDLFWRVKTQNPIRNWYFQKAEGSWKDKDNEWVVFWYGISDRQLMQQIIHHALTMEESFGVNTVGDKLPGVHTVGNKKSSISEESNNLL